MLKTQEILRSQLRVCLRLVAATRGFKSQRIESQASTNEPLCKLKEILARANVEEFNNLKKAYEETLKLTAIPDWITVKLASIAMSRQQDGEKILVQHWQMTGSDRRIDHQADVTKDQIAAALARVWQAACIQFDDQRSFHAVFHFYNRLRTLKFTPIRDTHVAQLIEYAIKSGYTTNALLELYRDLSQFAEKPMTKTIFLILNSARSEVEIQEIKEVVAKKISSSTLSLLDKFVALDRGKGPSLADELKKSNDPLKSDQLQQLVFWTSKWKRNNVVEELFEYAQLFGLDSFSKVLVYNALVLSYGKSSNTEGLRRIAKRIAKEDDRREFRSKFMSKRRFDDTVDNEIPNPWERKRFRALENASNVASTSQASGDSPSPERRLCIALRYPDGKRQIAELEVDTKVERLFQIIQAHGVTPSMVVVIKQFPKTIISLEDSQKTLSELGITTSEALFVEEK